jgi:hypothetical protein
MVDLSDFVRAEDAFDAVAGMYEMRQYEFGPELLLRRLSAGSLRAKRWPGWSAQGSATDKWIVCRLLS